MTLEKATELLNSAKNFKMGLNGNYNIPDYFWFNLLEAFDYLIKIADQSKKKLTEAITALTVDRIKLQTSIAKLTQCYPTNIRELGALFGLSLTKNESSTIYQTAKEKAQQSQNKD